MNSKQTAAPPRWAKKFLHWYCSPTLLEEVEGDLEEEFQFRLRHQGARAARFDYIRSVFGFMKPFAIKRKSSTNPLLPMNMFGHYFTVAFRQVLRHKAFSAINVIGLTLGITCCTMIYLWVNDEKSIDNFHTKGDRLYNVYMSTKSGTGVQGLYNTPMGLRKVTFNGKEFQSSYLAIEDAKEAIPGIEGIAFYANGYEMPWGKAEAFQAGDKVFKLEGARASEDFFKMFDYPLIEGDPATAIKDESSLAISRKMANMFFGSPQEAMGKSLRYEGKIDFQVTAVFEDLSSKSSRRFEFIAPWARHMKGEMDWSSGFRGTTLLLEPSADVNAITQRLNALAAPRILNADGVTTVMGLQPYRDQYLISSFENGKPSGGRIDYVEIFSGVAVFILIIACINFMNLATARSVKRAKEVGVRKVIGSPRLYLMGQFFGESLLLAIIALAASVLLIQVFLPLFNELSGKSIIAPLASFSTWKMLILLTFTTGILAGSYPALFLSSLKPVKVLKGVVSFTRNAIFVRRGLAVFQFGLSILLLIATIVMSKQTSFMKNVNAGFNKENLLYFTIEGTMKTYDKFMVFKNAAEQLPSVKVVDRSSEAPHAMSFVVDEDDGVQETVDATDTAIKWEGQQKGDKVGFKPTSVGFDFVNLMDLDVVQGRGFSRDNATDSADAFMINEQAVKEMGLKDPIGTAISAWAKKGHIIGVLKDYNTGSLHERIRPVIVDIKEYEYFGVVMVRTEAGKTMEAIEGIQNIYKQINPAYPFSFRFVDEDMNRMYSSEQIMTKLSNVFAVLAILISCLGLLGLVMFSAEQRTREIGIRKALGATVASIISLLSRDFLKIVLISFVVATPISAWLMSQWLSRFAYQIDLSWWIFAVAGIASLGVALATISVQAIQSAKENPVDSLRSE